MKKCLSKVYCQYKVDGECVLPESNKCNFLEEPFSELTRIADALDRIATALEKANELKAVEIKMGSIPAYREEHDGDELAKIIQSDVNEIMED